MAIDLKPEQQRVIDLAVGSGAYQSPDKVYRSNSNELVREQLALGDWMLERREAISAHIAEGVAQAERGELIDGDDVIAMLRQRRAERMKSEG